MRPFTFNPGPRLLAGPDQATSLAEKLPPGPCLLVTDADLIRLGLPDSYREAIGKDRELVVFDAVEADPSKATLLTATETGRADNARLEEVRRRLPSLLQRRPEAYSWPTRA